MGLISTLASRSSSHRSYSPGAGTNRVPVHSWLTPSCAAYSGSSSIDRGLGAGITEQVFVPVNRHIQDSVRDFQMCDFVLQPFNDLRVFFNTFEREREIPMALRLPCLGFIPPFERIRQLLLEVLYQFNVSQFGK